MLLPLIFLFLLQLASLTYGDEYKTYKNYKFLEISGNKQSIEELLSEVSAEFPTPVRYTNENLGYIMVSPDAARKLESLAKRKRLSTRIIINDLSKAITEEKRNPARGLHYSWTAYHNIDEIYSYLQNMSYLYSGSAQVITGGKSFEGRPILGLRINTQSSKKKPVIFIESGIHAREWIAPATTTYFINQLLTSNDRSIMGLRDNFDWHIFPSVNPDGYQYSWTHDRFWRKTRSKSPTSKCIGTDPNRNWDYNWGQVGCSDDPCDPELYRGAKPFSEIETKTLSEYISSLQNLRGYISFHSFSKVLLLPFSDSSEHIDNYDDLKKIGQASLEYGYRVSKDKYGGPATAAEILYPVAGGSMDWVRHAFKTPLVFTYELRGNNFLWPKERIPEQGEEVTQMILGMATAARKMGYFN